MLKCSFYDTQTPRIVESTEVDLYQYKLYVGDNEIATSKHSSYWLIDDDKVSSFSGTGSVIKSDIMCVEIYGYTPETRTSTYSRYTDLPYINGCSSKQLITPARPGDPTWQLLFIPENSSEQAHHIHSTSRIVYVLEGKGKSHVGVGEKMQTFDLFPGMIVVLDKMIPHHFTTQDSHLVVLPLHIFSSVNQEFNHPMFNGTHRV